MATNQRLKWFSMIFRIFLYSIAFACSLHEISLAEGQQLTLEQESSGRAVERYSKQDDPYSLSSVLSYSATTRPTAGGPDWMFQAGDPSVQLNFAKRWAQLLKAIVIKFAKW